MKNFFATIVGIYTALVMGGVGFYWLFVEYMPEPVQASEWVYTYVRF